MKIGYPCINLSLSCRTRTFRLKSYTEERLFDTVKENLACLARILDFNAARGILFFRISSDLVPFASHPVCRAADWQGRFRKDFSGIGSMIRQHEMRISMHPDQFIVLNSPRPEVVERSGKELVYHAEVLDLLGLDPTAKIQLHVGGVYGQKEKAMERFVDQHALLPEAVSRRLVIENDDRSYTLQDCLRIHEETGAPVLFDTLHHALNPSGEGTALAVELAGETWSAEDGLPMVDYSTGEPGERPGSHAGSIDIRDFRQFLKETGSLDMDIMLEIKDKEHSAVRALATARGDCRLTPFTRN
ncbi:MAG: UV DNA damage repair endonuclease UvsE [Methanomicrobiaceae archaeon]|nr:UV DNA damage repair endonuclease UvsE [Methanomicrobiaceae archaeon]